MAIGLQGSRGARSAMNVTPLIDVLLVLLIIFMLMQPSVEHGISALAPHPPETHNTEPDPRTLVISVDGEPGAPAYALNGQAAKFTELGPELQRVVRQGGQRPVFVQGAASLDYGAVAPLLNLAHAAGVEEIGILTPASRVQ